MAFKGKISVSMNTRTWTEQFREERPLTPNEPKPFNAKTVIVVSERGKKDRVSYSTEPVTP